MKEKGLFCIIATSDSNLSAMLSDVMAPSGYSSICCFTEREVEDCLEKHSIDLLVLDQELHGTNGDTVLNQVRSTKFRGPIVYISQPFEDLSTYARLRSEFDVSLALHPPLEPDLMRLQMGVFFHRQGQVENQAKDPVLADQIDQMKQKYANVLPLRLSKLKQAVTDASLCCRTSDLTEIQKQMKECLRLSHNLKGSGETYGFPMLSKKAAELESLFKDQSRGTEKPTDDFWQIVFKEVEMLSQLANEISKSVIAPVGFGNKGAAGNIVTVLLVATTPFETRLQRAGAHLMAVETLDQAREQLESRPEIDAVLLAAEGLGQEPCISFVREIREKPELENLPFGFIVKEKIDAQTIRTDAAHAGVSVIVDCQSDDKTISEAINYLVSVRPDGRSKVLIVDDDEDFLDLVSGVLRREGILVSTLQDSTKTFEELYKWLPDLILLDVRMPFFSGYDLCSMIRKEARWQDTPIIFITAETDMQSRIAAYECGGDDYLPKPVAVQELIARVKVRLEKAKMIKRSIQIDSLTGLLLRPPLLQKLDVFRQQFNRHKKPFSLALIDLDHFKAVNDNHGHLVGDEVLSTFARLAKSRFRAEDLRGRWGGEEFVFAFPGEESSVVTAILERFLNDFMALSFKNELGEPFSLSFSAGIAQYGKDSENIAELIKKADDRLYLAKARGRACIVGEE